PEGAEEDTGLPQPFISFGQWPQVNGKMCNNFRGKVEAKGETLIMENAAATMMLCGDTGLSELESMFFKMMHDGVSAAFGEDSSLTLTGGGHTLVFTISDYVN
ncbi:META domain-containing protein, partial [Deltaproteobacteria bacterium OttesenSCG-928-K17]|nr:META domain-containing protein [Deltaproteobacteria bacterium OttesenSCG-928-K17]